MAKLGDVCDILNGFAFKSEQYVEDGIRIIRIANVQKGYIEDSTPVFYPYDSKDAQKYRLEEGDMLMSLTGNVGRVAKLSKEFLPAALNQRVACLKIKDGISLDKAFLFNLLNSDYFEQKCIAESKGVAQKNMSTEWLKEYEIPMFPMEQQKAIASVLDKVTELIALRKEQLAKLDQLVKSRFIELFGTVAENPYGFQMATLKEVCHKITDGKHGGCEQEADSGYYYVGAREIYDDVIHYDTAPQITYADFAKDYKRCNIERGDMVIVNTGATIGKTAIATSPLTERTLLQKSVALLKVKTEIISAEFLRHCYMANPSMYKVESASAQPNLLLSKMNATRIYLPPIELQQQFAAFVEQTDKSKLAIQQSLDKLELLKKSLMQEYFG